MDSASSSADGSDPCKENQEPSTAVAKSGGKNVEELKLDGNIAFKKAQMLNKTTAGKQYLGDAKAAYIEAITKLSSHEVNEQSMELVSTLHSNLAAVFLMEVPPKWREAGAAAEIALAVEPKHVKALFRRAQATLEDNREGLPEANLRKALIDLDAAREVEPGNARISQEAERVRRRIEKMEDARKVPTPEEIVRKVPEVLLDRGADCLASHGYVWGQTNTTVHIYVPARGLKLNKVSDVAVEVGSRSLRLALSDSDGPLHFELTGKLQKPVRPDDCSWQLEEDGLLLHAELAKRVIPDDEAEGLDDERGEHWSCVWQGHPETRAPSAKEREKVQEMARAANRAEAEEKKPPEEETNPKAAEALRRMREMCPGVNVEWGDTSVGAWK
mmetsp:Transcript_10138/g.26037  ORF Transcript_10138/g.26037 Transcript_10138/m.26037 type:complete len:387 (+) Transcript_10138:63-1223(+)